MMLLQPWLLLGLLVLPVLWWLLRALPPAPRSQNFPAIGLLAGLQAATREPRRAPPWLLLLRILAAGLAILGLAQPVLVRGAQVAGGRGGLLLVIDDGWAAAPDWSARLQAARDVLEQAGRSGRTARLLLTAPDGTGLAPHPMPASPPGLLRDRLGGLAPMPWPVERGAAARALAAGGPGGVGDVVYISDGLAGDGDAALAAALHAAGPVTELRDGPAGLAMLERPTPGTGTLTVRVATLPQAGPRRLSLHGETGQGGVLARMEIVVPAGAATAAAALALPSELRNQLDRLVLDGMRGPGGVRLLDEGDRRRPVGLLTGSGADTPLLGSLFYLRRALGPVAELREGTLGELLSRRLSVLIAADGTLESPADRARVAGWVRQGGMLIRFAGPLLAARQAGGGGDDARDDARDGGGDGAGAGASDDDPDAPPAAAGAAAGRAGSGPDPLLPVTLLGGARALGGAMSWGHPEHPAPFPAGSPFAGLAVPDEVTVSRQVLAQPSADLAGTVWARLADGTPLVTHAGLGDGQLVLFHVTSNADWSNLPLSGLFPEMLQRLVQQAAGVASPGDRTVLAPEATLTGDGALGPPPPAATGLAADAFGDTPASPRHPAGLYGPAASRRSLNLADALPPLAVSPAFGALRSLDDRVPDRPLGPGLLALALALLSGDLLATMAVRGQLAARGGTRDRAGRQGRFRRPTGSAPMALLLAALIGACLPAAGHAYAVEAAAPAAALETRLAYVVTGDESVDTVSRQGLDGLSAYANARTSAQLGHPDGVVPGRDDLAFYPMIYWPVTPATVPTAPTAAFSAALAAYMNRGGILMIDTQGTDRAAGGTGGDGDFTLEVPGTRAALVRATGGLDVPPLRQVDGRHVLSHSFYLLHAYPGRYVGSPVWVARDEDLGNDGVSPVIIGANDWAGAWAVDQDGQAPYAVIPGGEAQRTLAYRFGVNAVIYALTGNYKTDQVHVPALLERLGE